MPAELALEADQRTQNDGDCRYPVSRRATCDLAIQEPEDRGQRQQPIPGICHRRIGSVEDFDHRGFSLCCDGCGALKALAGSTGRPAGFRILIADVIVRAKRSMKYLHNSNCDGRGMARPRHSPVSFAPHFCFNCSAVAPGKSRAETIETILALKARLAETYGPQHLPLQDGP